MLLIFYDDIAKIYTKINIIAKSLLFFNQEQDSPTSFVLKNNSLERKTIIDF